MESRNRRVRSSHRRGGRSSLIPLLVVLAAGPWFAAAHAYLDASEPAANAAATDPVTTVTLSFSEAIEVAFSSFKVYRLTAEVDLATADADMRLNALAAPLVTNYNGTAVDGDGKIDAEVTSPADDRSSVVLRFAGDLAPGHYVVMWRVLSVDTHVIDGHFVFTVAP